MQKNTQTNSNRNSFKINFIKCLAEAAAIYSLLIILMNLGVMISNGLDAASEEGYFSTLRTLLMAPAALFIALATAVRKRTEWQGLIRWPLHCVLTVCGIYFFILLPGLPDTTSGKKLVYFAVVLVIYIITVLLSALIYSKAVRAVDEDRKYRNK